MSQKPRTVFMGTPDFAVPCLQALVDAGYPIVGVYTQPDRPVGRKQVITPPPVKQLAESLGLPVFQPTKLRDGTVVAQLKELGTELIVVVAYGRILPKDILELPKYAAINVHASLLPKYRGAAPIQWAIANEETETGVTIMIMGEGLDTGPMLAKGALPIHADDTSATLFPQLSALGASLLVETLADWTAGKITPEIQDDSQATLAPIIEREHGLVDWQMSAARIWARGRGFTPWPGIHTYLGDKAIKLITAQPLDQAPPPVAEPGTIIDVSAGYVDVACGEGILRLLEVQPAGGKLMSAGDFARGCRLQPGDRLQATLLA